MKYYTYLHLTPEGEVFYIGKGKGNRAYATKDRNKYWHNTVNKHGGYQIEICKRWETDQEAITHEIYLIAEYKKKGFKLVNMTNGGEGHSGCIKSPETLAKLSLSLKGRIVSQETRNKISQKHLGKTVKETTKEKLRQHNLGKKHSEKSRLKISLALKNRKIKEESREKMRGDKNPMANPQVKIKHKIAMLARSQNLEYLTKLRQNNGMKNKAKKLVFEGFSLTIKEWTDKLGLSKNTIRQRLKNDWALEKVLSPVKYKGF